MNRLRAEAARSASPLPVEDIDEAPTVVDRVVTPEQLTAMRAEFEKNRSVTTPPPDEIPRNTVAIPKPPASFETQPIMIRPPESPHTQSEPPPTLIIPMPPEVSQAIPAASVPASQAPPRTLPEAPLAEPTTESRRVATRPRNLRPLWVVGVLLGLVAIAFAAVTLRKQEPLPVETATRAFPPRESVTPAPTPVQQDPAPVPVQQEVSVETPPPIAPDVAPPAVETAPPPPATVTAAPPAPAVAKKRPPRRRRPEPARTATTAPAEPPPPVVQEGELVKLGEAGVVLPRLTHDVEPKLPMRARMSAASVIVELSLLVDHRGNVEEVKVAESSGNALLDNAAKTAAVKARFTPATKHGVPVRIWITRNYIFRRGS